MGTVGTTTSAVATAYGNQRRTDRCQNGVLWAVRSSGGALNPFQTSYSTDGGSTWTDAEVISNGAGGTSISYTANASFFVDVDDYGHIVFKDPVNGYLYYRRGTPNAGRTAYTWSAAVLVDNSDSNYNYPDIAAHREGSGWTAHLVYSYTQGTANSNVKAFYNRINITSAGAATLNTPNAVAISATLASSNANAGYPSIDFNHTGDGKIVAGGTPHLYVGWSAGATGSGYGIRYRKATYSGGSWTWGTEVEVSNARFAANANYWINCLFDGTRVIMPGWISGGSTSTYDAVLHEIDATTSAVTQRTLISNTGEAGLASGSGGYDTAGNAYLFGTDFTTLAGNGQRPFGYRKWTRQGAALGSFTVVDATTSVPYGSVRRGPQGSAIDYVYTDGTTSPYTVTSGRITLNVAPNAGGKPTPDGANLDRTVAQSFSYAFSDPDAGDQPSKTDWRWRTSPVSGTPGAWNTSTVTGNATSITYPANTFPAGRVELQVLPYDSQGVVAPAWSDSAFDTAANPPTAPTFSAPAAGSTIATSSVTATIVADTLDAHQWRVMGDTSGSANATVVNAGATIEDPTSRTFTVTGLANAQTVHLQDRRRVGGIWSPWADNGAQAVSYTPPPPATIVLTPLPGTAKLSVAWTIPAPTGSEPAVSTVDVYVDDGTAEGLRRIAGTGAVDRAPGASPWVHDTPALLREYGNGTGRVVVVVKGVNGTTRTTAS